MDATFYKEDKTSGSSSYADFFLIFFYACAWLFYDAFFFYHKAYYTNEFKIK
ncbi:hypothetical protein Niako_5794 [Niastella koreensis GR20-10]|uniref:Uncharacterized protein n=1 Tax=Niastella koreensis (strain DSM 17620 / KACC 11465 / NBRC 106392 / GR20-10) TaxID=700598 RepID=G8TNU0_NIAKG|nr:hypothetical protein Niako_5794 [Niastella koreensis GR20-10]